MGVYNAAVITNNGLSLIAQAAAGQGQIVFTSAQTSSYAYPESTDFANLTSLQDVVQTQTSISAEVFNDTLVQATVRFDNSAVTSQYLIQTIGLFAQLGDSGSPVLFSVVTATTPDQMPAQSAVSPSAFVYVIQSTVQQASSIVVTTNLAGTATLQDLQNYIPTANIDNNLTGTAPTHVLSSPQGAVLFNLINQINSNINIYAHAIENGGSLAKGIKIYPSNSEQVVVLAYSSLSDVRGILVMNIYEQSVVYTGIQSTELVPQYSSGQIVLPSGAYSRGFAISHQPFTVECYS